jgi:hypothetical protein
MFRFVSPRFTMLRMYCKSLAALVVAAGVAVAAMPAQASISFTLDNYTVSANSGAGLVVQTADVLSQPYGFDLDGVGDSVTVDLFEIWTPEQQLDLDDVFPQVISVAFDFIAPQPSFGGLSTGVTGAATILIGSGGYLSWDGPIVLNFGPNGDGQLQISLSNEIFNPWFGTNFRPGQAYGATVEAEFTLLAEASAPVVPEPTTILVWSGLALMGLVAGRRLIR